MTANVWLGGGCGAATAAVTATAVKTADAMWLQDPHNCPYFVGFRGPEPHDM